MLTGLHGSVVWQGAVVAGTVLWLVAYTNGFNFMDGIDGISVAQATVAGIVWYVLGRSEHVSSLAVGGAIVAGAVIGFAPFNLLRARMFLGDVGSYFLGAWLAALAVLGLRAGIAPEAVLAPLSPCTWPTPASPWCAGSAPVRPGICRTATTRTNAW